MMKHYLYLTFLGLFFWSCGNSLKTNLTNNFEREKLANDEVFVFYNESELPSGSKEVGSIKISDHGLSKDCTKDGMLNDAKAIAKSNNTNILLIDELKEPDNIGRSCYHIKGRLFYNNNDDAMRKLWSLPNDAFIKKN